MDELRIPLESAVQPGRRSRLALPPGTEPETDQAWAGRSFGSWTVLGQSLKTARGERKWLCRCACGTQRYVLERALRSGGSLSCGCVRRRNAADALAYDLTGQVFGQLQVLRRADDQSRNGGVWWLCQCSCGSRYEVPASLLVTGKRTHCGGTSHEKHYARADIAGQRFHRLVALYPLAERDGKGSVLWHCRCDCGSEVDVAYNSLMYSRIKSCGCQKKEHDQKLGSFLTHVDGTSIDMLKSQKLPSNNTTGVKGVYFVRGRYLAKVVFQKKQYTLGSYKTLEEAAQVRKDAEETLHQTVLEHYAAWNARAAEAPDWAAEHPLKFAAEKDAQGRLQLRCQPSLAEMAQKQT